MKPRKKSADLNMNILELAHHLRQEHLFILSEKQQIQKINSKVGSNLSWTLGAKGCHRDSRGG